MYCTYIQYIRIHILPKNIKIKAVVIAVTTARPKQKMDKIKGQRAQARACIVCTITYVKIPKVCQNRNIYIEDVNLEEKKRKRKKK